jgi:hypothetical protein
MLVAALVLTITKLIGTEFRTIGEFRTTGECRSIGEFGTIGEFRNTN